MKKIYAVLIAVLLVAFTCGCNQEQIPENAVVCTSFPQYFLAKSICPEGTHVVMLVPVGSEGHDFEPTANHIKTVEKSKLFVYNGGVDESWVEKLLSDKEGINKIPLLECIKDPVYVNDSNTQIDEHIWLSPENMLLMAEAVYKGVSAVFPNELDVVNRNYSALVTSLTKLDSDMTELSKRLKGKTVVLGDRNPFVYLARDYSLNIISAYHGCGHESEPSAAQIVDIISKAKAADAKTVYYLDFSSGNIAKTIAAQLDGATVLPLYSCRNITKEQFEKYTLIDLMYMNMENLGMVANAAD